LVIRSAHPFARNTTKAKEDSDDTDDGTERIPNPNMKHKTVKNRGQIKIPYPNP